MTIKNRFAVLSAVVALTFMSLSALADEHPYTEGQIVNVSAVRTENGKFEEYMKFVDTTWKAAQEAAKKAGYVTGYKVITVEPRGENDPDLYLVIYFKNWAALDGANAKGDAIANEVWVAWLPRARARSTAARFAEFSALGPGSSSI
jgi:hypothetical protein